ncbi:MAG: eukaryotic-like serine/threonine-protein kinase [Actinoplanes sp.]|jgi:serine/threonine-protein kinase|nr:eukaryotic-like serine/threonine-protein kinase [Actinoplanes sp.]
MSTADLPDPGQQRRDTPNRVLAFAGIMVAVGAGAFVWSLASVNDKSPANSPALLAADGRCVVSYAVWADTGSTFKSLLVVANRDTAPMRDWSLRFVMPGDQSVSGTGELRLSQTSSAVQVATGKDLAPQASATMQITGRYVQNNDAPMVFNLDGHSCQAYVSGSPGEPSRPVQHLSDDTTRLGPVPAAAGTPVPGLSTAPNGMAVPVPTDPPTAEPIVVIAVSSPTRTGGPKGHPPAPLPGYGGGSPPASDPQTGPPPGHPGWESGNTTTGPTTDPTTAEPAA